MKKKAVITMSWVVIAILAIAYSSCRKDPIDVNYGRIEVIESVPTQLVNNNDTLSAVFHGRYSYSGRIKKLYLQMSLRSDLSEPNEIPIQVLGNEFVVSVDFLLMDTTYYYRYVVRRHSEEFMEDLDWKDSIRTLSTHNLTLPKVKTERIEEINRTSAICSGIVIDEGGRPLIERGICWSNHPHPTKNDSFCNDQEVGLGEYQLLMSDLQPATTYYVRAFAENSVGCGYDTVDVVFNTKDFTVVTNDPTEITGTSVWLNAEIFFDYEGEIHVEHNGFLLGTTPYVEEIIPWGGNIPPSYAPNRVGFMKRVSGLEYETTYYVRAYAIDYRTGDTVCGELKTFITLPAPPAGTIDGLFSISESKQVYFSKGNLQYQASTNTWRFAENQWDFVGGTYFYGDHIGNINGSTNNDISSTYSGWIDLFGWGTSGFDHGAVCYQPWSVSRDSLDYRVYGCSTCNLFDQTGKADWGYNIISNGGDFENIWRTLTTEEWKYLFNLRKTPSGIRYAKARVNSVNGVIVLPDNWRTIAHELNELSNVNSYDASFETNNISLSNWIEKYENYGAVFLPAAGCRWENWVLNPNENGFYWSSSNRNEGFVYCIWLTDTYFTPQTTDLLFYGRSVRLVRPAR